MQAGSALTIAYHAMNALGPLVPSPTAVSIPTATPSSLPSTAGAQAQTGATLLTGVVVGTVVAIVGALSSHFLQRRREKEADARQQERDTVAYQRQLELQEREYRHQHERQELEYEQQRQRDAEAYAWQRERDEGESRERRHHEAITYRHEVQQAKRRRLHTAYKRLLLVVEAWESAVKQQAVVYEGETRETRDQRLSDLVRNELKGINDAVADVALEDTGEEVETLFYDIRSAYDRYWIATRTRQDHLETGIRGTEVVEVWHEMQRYELEISEKLRLILSAMKSRLRALESPVSEEVQ